VLASFFPSLLFSSASSFVRPTSPVGDKKQSQDDTKPIGLVGCAGRRWLLVGRTKDDAAFQKKDDLG